MQYISTKGLKGHADFQKNSKKNRYIELCKPFSRIINSFLWIRKSVLPDCNLFPRIQQSVTSDCNSFPRLQQSVVSDCNSFSRFYHPIITNLWERISNPWERIAQFDISIFLLLFLKISLQYFRTCTCIYMYQLRWT